MDGGPERFRMMYSEAKSHEGEALTAGSQELAWTLNVPDNLPHSIRFPRGGIEYTLAARLDYSGVGFMAMGSLARTSITVPVKRHLTTTAELGKKTRLADTLKEGLTYDVQFPNYVCVEGQEFVRIEIKIIKTDHNSPQLKEVKIKLKQKEKYWRNPPLYLDGQSHSHGIFQVLSLADPESHPISFSLPVPTQYVPDSAAEPSKTPILSTIVRLPVPRAYSAAALVPSASSGKRSSLAAAKSVFLNTASNDAPLLPRTHSSKVKIEHVWEVVFVREGVEDVTISAPVAVGTIKDGAETIRAVEAARGLPL
ncbi:hypothetical protein BC937DRAFT_86871 [Endogone sp. FLAS-F59071]|nr:hypothetical protein BC937DRAFT_86871 [Endogone sp. FLAS-F59071]|eukprot:RUS19807.1 hypothetical protein BC937DRAFT_86871 [Endogone sp. FLAS-F59071]